MVLRHLLYVFSAGVRVVGEGSFFQRFIARAGKKNNSSYFPFSGAKAES